MHCLHRPYGELSRRARSTAQPTTRTTTAESLSSPTLLTFVEYLRGRWQAGCTNVAQLKRELNAQGFRGSYSLMMQVLEQAANPATTTESSAVFV